MQQQTGQAEPMFQVCSMVFNNIDLDAVMVRGHKRGFPQCLREDHSSVAGTACVACTKYLTFHASVLQRLARCENYGQRTETNGRALAYYVQVTRFTPGHLWFKDLA